MVKCNICYEDFPNSQDGISCESESHHFICNNDFSQYMAENVLPKMYKIRETNCKINCPCHSCESTYETMVMYERLLPRERTRFLTILNEIASTSHPIFNTLRKAIFDILTLKCPSCHVPVDPFPDACSAVMCLNCGNHYCNYCFESFDDRGRAHEHVSSHTNSSDNTLGAGPFLPQDVVTQGQQIYRVKELEKFIILSLSSTDTSINWSESLKLALILCVGELKDVDIDIFEFWKIIEFKYFSKFISLSSSSSNSSINLSFDNLSTSKSILSNETNNSVSTIAKINPTTTTSAFTGIQQGSTLIDNDDEAMIAETSETDDTNIIPTNLPTTAATSNQIVNNMDISRQGAILLCNALMTKNHEAAKQIINSFKNQIDANFIEPSHECPIASLAILSEEEDIAIHLFKIGASPLLNNREQRNSIYIACEYGYRKVLECMFEVNPQLSVQLNEPVTGEMQRYTPLHVAARYGRGNLISWLVEKGSSTSLREREHGYTALSLALVLGDEWCARELLMSGSALDVTIPAYNSRTALFIAAEKGLSDFLRLAIKKCQIDVNIPVRAPNLMYLLHVAVVHQETHFVSELIKYGADLNVIDETHGYTPLAMAIVRGCTTAAILLIRAGANLRIPCKFRRLPMYLAIEYGHKEIVETLVHAGISVNERICIQPDSAILPLHIAIRKVDEGLLPLENEILEFLLKSGANPNIPIGLSYPLIRAVEVQKLIHVKLLLEYGAKIDQPHACGMTALAVACRLGNTEIVNLLLQHMPSTFHINAPVMFDTPMQLNKNETCLHIAVLSSSPVLICYLLDQGAEPSIKDKAGFSVYDIVEASLENNNNDSNVQYILSRYKNNKKKTIGIDV